LKDLISDVHDVQFNVKFQCWALINTSIFWIKPAIALGLPKN
jgi:hypothetical protein